MPHRKMGWRPQLPDNRDYRYQILKEVDPPIKLDLRALMPPIYDQGNLGSCTGNAIGAAFHYEHVKQGLEDFIPSRLFNYYNARAMENSIQSDSGAVIRDGIKSIAKQGICPETFWPYIIERFAERPTGIAYKEALKHTAISYQAVPPNLETIKKVIVSERPVVFGFTVYSSFESETTEQTGYMQMPDSSDVVVGGHAVVVTGYDDESQHLICRNSWGETWGDSGYFYMPYSYVLAGLCADFWVVQVVR